MLNIPYDDEYSFLNPTQNNNINFRNIIKTLFLPISIVAFIFFFTLLLISYFDKNQKEIYISNEIKQIFLLNYFFEKPLNKIKLSNDYIYYKNEEKRFNNEFIKNLSYINYEGEWFEQNDFNLNGLLYLQFSKNKNLNLIIRLTEGSYIDNWKIIYNEIPIKKLKIEDKIYYNYVLFEGEFISEIENGKIFERENLYSNCKTYLTLNFTKNINKTINFKENIKGILKTKCSNLKEFNIQINIKRKNPILENNNIRNYSILTIFISLLMILNTNMIKYKLNNSENFANGISLFTIYENIIWNSYGCLCHFFLTLNYPTYLYYFIFPTIVYFLNFSFTDLKFLYTIWRLKYQKDLADINLIKRKLIQLYFTFYLGMFFSLFFVTKFFFYKPYIIIGILLTWTPQIIFNIYYDNRISLPWSYIILTSIYRLFIPCYFRLNKNNFFLISPDYFFSFFIISLMIFQIFILYCQSIKGSRFFLPNKFRKNYFDFYKNKKEILFLNPNANNIECVICLNNIFNEIDNIYNAKFVINDYITLDENEHIQILRKNYIYNLYEEKNNNWKNKYFSLFNFNKRNINIDNKKYIMTPCKHLFHSKCLEMWLQRKKECPNCRKEINLNI